MGTHPTSYHLCLTCCAVATSPEPEAKMMLLEKMPFKGKVRFAAFLLSLLITANQKDRSELNAFTQCVGVVRAPVVAKQPVA